MSLKVRQLGMNFELLFTPEVIPPSRWVSSSKRGKRGLGKDGWCIHSSMLQFTTRQSSEDQRSMLDNPIYDQTIKAQLRVNIYCIFHFQMGGNLECIRYCIYDSIRYCIYDSIASPFVPQSSRSFTQPPPFLCVTSRSIGSVHQVHQRMIHSV